MSAGFRVWSLAKYSIPIHALLPLVVWGVGSLSESLLMGLLWVIHLGFPIILLGTYDYWKGQGTEVAVLILVNHLTTFTIGTALIVWLQG